MPSESDLASRRESLLPWRRAESLHDSLVLWAPCRFQEISYSQRTWLSLFFDRCFAQLVSRHGLTEEFFMQMDVLQKDKKLSDKFHANLLKEQPFMGRSISWLHGPQKTALTDEEIELLVKGKVQYDYHAMSTPRACWFRGSDARALRDSYMGFGGMTVLLIPQAEENKVDVKPMQELMSRVRLPAFMRNETTLKALVEGLDPKNPFAPPPFIRSHPAMVHMNATFGPRKYSPEQRLGRMMFGLRTKEVFGAPLKADPSYAGIPFLLPKLASVEIFHSTPEERASWLKLFEVYLTESSEDGGMLLLTKCEFLPEIVEVLASLRKDGYTYWEG
jgi:hypothetical protein